MEGIYKASGDLAPIDKINALKDKYKFRLVVDESFAFGVLGKNGRGACEHFGLKPGDAVVCSSMGEITLLPLITYNPSCLALC